jgi:hypothetical protein
VRQGVREGESGIEARRRKGGRGSEAGSEGRGERKQGCEEKRSEGWLGRERGAGRNHSEGSKAKRKMVSGREGRRHTIITGGCFVTVRCEFTIGPGADGQPVVGFCLGAYKHGITTVAPPEGCPHISGVAVQYAGLLQAFLRSRSRLPVWNKRLNRGT